MITEDQHPIVEAAAAFVVGPGDRIVVSLPEANQDDLQEIHDAFAAKGFDMSRVLIMGGPAIQLGVIRGDDEERS